MIDPKIKKIRYAVVERFPTVGSLGIYNRRPIAGTSVWSQHAWGNAWDIAPPEDEKPSNMATPSKTLDEVARFLRYAKEEGLLPVGHVLWRRDAHWDHIHVCGDPHYTGTPPVLDNQEDDEMKDFVEAMQRALRDAGFSPGPIDGIMGPKTEAALTAAFKYGGGHDERMDALIRAVKEM